MDRVLTGSAPLDQALGGGVEPGTTLLVEGPQGVGSTEFAFTLLRTAARQGRHGGVFATALRSSARAQHEAVALLGEDAATSAKYVALRADHERADLLAAMDGTASGDVLVVESMAALARAEHGLDLVALIRAVADAAHEKRAVVILLHVPGTLPSQTEQALAELADGVLTFGWRDGGPTRRRSLFITKLRGLAPALDGEQVPVFEAALQTGTGFTVSRVKSVV